MRRPSSARASLAKGRGVIPIHQLLHRIQWDPRYRGAAVEIGYTNRPGAAIVRVAFEDVRLTGGPRPSLAVSSGDGRTLTVPLHRVREVWREGMLVWERPAARSPARDNGTLRLSLCVAQLALLVVAGGLAPANRQARTGSTPLADPPALEKVREWAVAVEHHEVGTFDEPAQHVAGWNSADVRLLGQDLQPALRFLAGSHEKTFKCRGQLVSLQDVQAALGLTARETAGRDPTRVVRRAALLHADIARRSTRPESAAWGAIPTSRPGDLLGMVDIADGRVLGNSRVLGHWRFGRFLLDWVVQGERGPDATDPWWDYLLSAGRHADRYFEEARAACLDAERR